MAEDSPLSIVPSEGFAAWLASVGSSLAFTTYQTNRLFLVGLKPDGGVAAFERLFDRPMGLYATPERITMSTRWQLWELDDALAPGQTHRGFDRLYVPRHARTTGALDIHDVAVDGDGRTVFVNTAYSCLATTSERYSFEPLWKPPFISALAPEDRCHLNGLAMDDGKAAYVTAVAVTDTAGAWREHRHEGGCVIDVRSGEVVTRGLSMPHAPRVHRGKLWLLNSGTGELGYVDSSTQRFEPVAFCPGFLRGLAFAGDHAVVGLSKQRQDRTFAGLSLDERLKVRGAEPRCGLWVVDLRTGEVVHTLTLEGVVIELYDVQVLADVRRAMALGFRNDEIQRFITVDGIDGPVFKAFEARRPS